MQKLALLLCLVLSSCMPPACNISPTIEQKAQEDTNKFNYYKDQETDLCFVLMDYRYATMQVVECTTQVESKINKRLKD